MFRTNRYVAKCFLDNTKLANENISIRCFSAATEGLTLSSFLIVWTPVKN